MTIELWDWLEEMNFLVGMDFPEADEDALWRCSLAWSSAASELRALIAPAGSAGTDVVAALHGEAGDAFTRLWAPFQAEQGYLEELSQQCDRLATACDRTASDVEYAKLEYIAALAVLAATLAAFAASLVFGGVSALGMPAAIAFAQFSVRLIITRLITNILVGVGFIGGMDVFAQLVQVFDGHRHEWDWSKTLRATEDGAIFGAVGGGAFLGLGRLASPSMRTLPGMATVIGVADLSGVVGSAASSMAHGEIPTFKDLQKAAEASLLAGLASAHHGAGRDAAVSSHGSDVVDAWTTAAVTDRSIPIDLGPSHPLADVSSLVHDGAVAHPGEPKLDGHPTATVNHVMDGGMPAADPPPGPHPSMATDAGAGLPPPEHRSFAQASASPAAIVQDAVTESGTLGDKPSVDQRQPANPHGRAEPVLAPTATDRALALSGRSGPDGGPPPSVASAIHPRAEPGLLAAVGLGRVETTLSSVGAPLEHRGPDGGLDGGADLAAADTNVATGAREAPPVWAARSAQESRLIGWLENEGPAYLTPPQNGAAEYMLHRAQRAEPALTALMHEVADRSGGELVGLKNRLKEPNSLKEKLFRYLQADTGETVADALARITDSVRYTIELPDESYAALAQSTIDDLIGRGLRPVSDRRSWNGEAGYVGLNTVWFDEVTGHTFEVQLHTGGSFFAKTVTHDMYQTIRKGLGNPELRAEHDAHFTEVDVPDGADAVGIPDSVPRHPPTFDLPDEVRSRSAGPYRSRDPDPTDNGHWDSGHADDGAGDATSTSSIDDFLNLPIDPRRAVTDAEAVALVRQHVAETDAGLAFYPVHDQMRDFARGMRPAEGLITLDLHGSRTGFQVDYGLLTPEQFARALLDLRGAGKLDLPEGVGIKLVSCDTAFGGEYSPAARLARALGIDVVAPDEPIWTTIDGFEIVSSPSLVAGILLPTLPPDGAWHQFTANGREVPLARDPSGRQWNSGGNDPTGHFIPREELSGLDPP
jgi:hypothetical protein